MELLERHFDIALETPDGVKKLRELILSLAMQGKLVSQDPKDQPASELLKEIETEKKKLIKVGKIRNQEASPAIKDSEIPYVLPNGWKWVRLCNVVSLLGDGIHGTPIYDEKGEHFFINGNNLSNGKIEIKNDTKTVSLKEYVKYKKNLNRNSVLVSINGTIGNIAFYNGEKIILGKSACYFNLMEGINKYFIKRIFNSNYFLNYAFSSATGTTIKNVSLKSMREFPIPIPPFNEQNYIVKKIDQLMTLCDKLEAVRDKRKKLRLSIHTAAMDRLLTAPDSSAFNSAWDFITNHFSSLYSLAENVTDLKKVILQLAVMGKLVTQDPNDQPASELLKEIETEKKKLIKEGKIKKQEPLPPIKESEIPYELPIGWEWVKLDQVCSKITDGDHKTPPRINYGKRLLSAKNVRDGFIDYNNCDFISDEHYNNSRKRCCPEVGDLLIVSVGGTIGRTSLILDDDKFALVRSVALVKPLFINSKYMRIVMNSKLLQDTINDKKRGGAQPCLYLSEIERFICPIPPYNEQKRIVEKIDQLMELCNSLEQLVKDSTDKQSAIFNAILAKI